MSVVADMISSVPGVTMVSVGHHVADSARQLSISTTSVSARTPSYFIASAAASLPITA